MEPANLISIQGETGSFNTFQSGAKLDAEIENKIDLIFQIEQLTFLGSLFLMIVIGNSAVLGALILTKTPRKSRMNFFIMHLALAGKSLDH